MDEEQYEDEFEDDTIITQPPELQELQQENQNQNQQIGNLKPEIPNQIKEKIKPRLVNASRSYQNSNNKINKMSEEENLEVYRNRMFTPTSKRDLLYMLDNKVKIVTYEELDNYKTLEELLEPWQAVIILYENHENAEIGHWVTIFKMPGANNKMLEYFDSYGSFVDQPVSEWNKQAKRLHEPNRIEPKLIELILESPYKDNVEWNEQEFQSSEIAVDTCGLWAVIRLKNNILNENGFKKKWYDIPASMNVLPDLVVSATIVDLFPEMR
jgi:hypothetical protein